MLLSFIIAPMFYYIVEHYLSLNYESYFQFINIEAFIYINSITHTFTIKKQTTTKKPKQIKTKITT